MNVLALSSDAETLGHVARIFSDQVGEIAPLKHVPQFLDATASGKWKVFVVDYDLLKSLFPNPLDFVGRMPDDAHFIFVGSHSFADWHDQLRTAGAIVLHKPNTVGELGIALRKLAADQAKPKTAKRSVCSSVIAIPRHAVK